MQYCKIYAQSFPITEEKNRYGGGVIVSFKYSYESWGNVFNVYECDMCQAEIGAGHPHTFEDNQHFCWECSFIKGFITEIDFCKYSGMSPGMFAAGINPKTNEIEFVRGKCKSVWRKKHREYVRTSRGKFSWEMSDKDYRQSAKYKKWRTGVFERDDYTCQSCMVKGGDIQAHHIKTFKKYKDLRYDIDNGKTLCRECHRAEHKIMRQKLSMCEVE